MTEKEEKDAMKKILFMLIGKNQKEQKEMLLKIKRKQIDECISKDKFRNKK